MIGPSQTCDGFHARLGATSIRAHAACTARSIDARKARIRTIAEPALRGSRERSTHAALAGGVARAQQRYKRGVTATAATEPSLCKGEGRTMEAIVNLIIQLVAGVVGGNAAGAALKDYNLGGVGNTIAGAIGGVGGGQLLQALIPAIAAAAGGSGGLGIGARLRPNLGGGGRRADP